MAKSIFSAYPPKGLVLLLVPFIHPVLHAQNASLALASGTAVSGGSVALPMTFSAGSGAPAGLEWTMTYPSASVTSVSVAAASALTAAGKTVQCNSSAGQILCMASGLNDNTIGSGTVATATFTLSASSSGSVPISLSAVASSASGSGLMTSATGGAIAVQAGTTTLSSLQCSPASLSSGGSSTCTVTLSGAAPSGGSAVALSSSSSAVTVPASVTVAAGATSATFKATAGTVSAAGTTTITATYNGASKTATIALTASTTVSSLACSPTSLGSNKTSTCTVTLSQAAPTGGAAVALSSNNASLTVPASVTVAAAANAATFTATSGTVSSNQSVTITATYNGSSATATITLTPAISVSSLACSPSSLGSNKTSTCTVTLSQAAPTGGAAVALSSNNATLTVPASVTVAAAATAATFTATSGTVSSNRSVTVTATYSGSSATANITLTPAITVSSLACSPSSLGSNKTSTCTATLSQAAPTGGAAVALSSSNAALTVPASVTVVAAATTATFTATSGTVSSNQSVTVTATYSGSSATATVTLTLPVTVSSLSCSPSTLASSSTSTCTVTLSGAAPSGGASVALSSNNAALTVPASMTIAAATTSGTFTATSGTVGSNQTVTVTATYSSSSKTATVSLTAAVGITSLACSPSSLPSNSTSTCTVTLSQTAPAGGATVTLGTNTAALTVPASVTVAAKSASQTFSAVAGSISSSQPATITATLGSSSQTTIITLAAGTVTAPAFVQEKDNQITTGTTNAVTLSTSTTAGNLLVVYLIWDNPGTATVTDSNGNKYVSAMAATKWGGQNSIQTFYAINGKTGVDTVTATFATKIQQWGILYAHEYSGISQTTPIDGVNAASGGSAAVSSGTITTSNSSDLLFAGVVSDSVISSPGAGFTARSTFAGNLTEDRFVSSAGSYTATATNSSGPWAIQTVAFRGAGTTTTTAKVLTSSSATTPSSSTASNAASLRSLYCLPRTVQAGGTVSCELRTGGTGPQQFGISANSQWVHVPTVVSSRRNQTSLAFLASVNAVAGQQTAVITAAAASVQTEDSIAIQSAHTPVMHIGRSQIVKTGEQLRFTVEAADPDGLPLQLSASALPSGAAFDASTADFQWTPTQSQSGKYRVTFTATNSAGQSSAAEVGIDVGSGAPVLDSSQLLACSPGARVSVFGKWLSSSDTAATDPSGARDILGGTTVTVNGQAVPIVMSSPREAQFVCPTLAAGTPISVSVRTADGSTTNPIQATMQEAAPVILSLHNFDGSQGMVTFAGTSDIAMPRNARIPATPAQPGDTLEIWATGLGQNAEDKTLNTAVTIAGVDVPVESIQAVPGYAGLYMLQVQAPNLPGDALPLSVRLNTPRNATVQSNTVTIAIESGRN